MIGRRALVLALTLSIALVDGASAGDAVLRPVPSPEAGWPQFRGHRRDGACDEKGLLPSWPEGGPRVIWTARGLGSGWSSPVISGGRIFIAGETGGELRIHALDLEGKPLWTATNGRAWKGPYPGARAIPAFAGGRLFHMNGDGRVACLDAATGKEVWAVDTLERFAAKAPTWGRAECLLVHGGRVFVTPGGRKAAMAALDAASGDTVWASGPVVWDEEGGDGSADGASYSSPVLVKFAGRRMLLACTSRHVLGVDEAAGKVLWKRPIPTTYEVLASMPVPCGDTVFMTGPDAGGGRLYRLRVEGDGVRAEDVWTTDMDTCHGGVIRLGDVLAGSWYRRYNGWGCVDLATGKTLHRTKDLVMGSALLADGRLYVLAQDGWMALVEADAKSFRIVSRFRLGEPAKGKDAWAHPVILDGRLYLRFEDRLECRDVKAPGGGGTSPSAR
jgi:outer membrane protein assembly factor BamB